MKTFFTDKSFSKKSKLAIGLMSGTSLDGVDAVCIEIRGSGIKTKFKTIGFITYPFPAGLKEKIIENSLPDQGNVSDICKLNFLIPHIYADAIKQLLTKLNLKSEDISFIGSHGQTIHHLPNKENYYGYEIGSTLQIGDPSVMAKLTGILTVGDFRTGDIALGGQGAPLVPYFDYLMFRSTKKNIALLNIGGISNISILRKNCEPEDVIAFDTGPGNILIDSIAKEYFNLPYDADGKIAANGKIVKELVDELVSKDIYLNKLPPKSTGREYYNKEFLGDGLKNFSSWKPKDILSTITYYTAFCVYYNYIEFIKDKISIDELIISGGGANNPFLMKQFKSLFKEVKVHNLKDKNISNDNKEAICFAVLANETLNGNFNNMPVVTGANRKTVLGKICQP